MGAKPRKKPVLLSGGNPQIAKADGEAPVRAYLAALPGWKRAMGKRIDAVVVRTVPGVRKAVKWNSPFYGIEGQGWFLAMHAFNHYLKLTFFRGAYATTYGPLMAGYALASLPLLALFLLTMRAFIAGLTSGALKA